MTPARATDASTCGPRSRRWAARFRRADAREPNDRLGAHAAPLAKDVSVVDATLDRFDDPRDVYRVGLTAGQRVVLSYAGPNAVLFLWRANGTLAAVSRTPGSTERIAFRPAASNKFFAEVRLPSGPGGAYRLTIERG